MLYSANNHHKLCYFLVSTSAENKKFCEVMATQCEGTVLFNYNFIYKKAHINETWQEKNPTIDNNNYTTSHDIVTW